MADNQVERVSVEDYEWMTELLEQAKICQQEANTLQQFTIQKLARKYNLGPADQIDSKTGLINRQKPNLTVETNDKVSTISDKKE